MSTRVWLPASVVELAAWHAAGEAPAAVEQVRAESDDEADEYAALLAAADASAAALVGPGRRVVVVAEVAAPGRAVPLREWAAVHVDTEDRDVDADPDDDLAWYAVQEVPDLLAELDA